MVGVLVVLGDVSVPDTYFIFKPGVSYNFVKAHHGNICIPKILNVTMMTCL